MLHNIQARHRLSLVLVILLFTLLLATVPASAESRTGSIPLKGTWTMEPVAPWSDSDEKRCECSSYYCFYDKGIRSEPCWGQAPFSLAIDGSNTPHIAYYLYPEDAPDNNSHLMYASRVNGRWVPESVLTYGEQNSGNETRVYSPSLAIDARGIPAIGFGEGMYFGTLKFARKNGNTWDISIVDKGTFAFSSNSTLGNAGHSTSLAFDAQGIPHISYIDGSQYANLMYASWNSTGWERSVVDYGTLGHILGDTGYSSSLAIDRDGHPHIAYRDGRTYGSLKYAVHDGNSWKTVTVDRGHIRDPDTAGSVLGDTGADPSLALAPDGRPVISYEDFREGALMLAVRERDTPDLSFNVTILDAGRGSSGKKTGMVGAFSSLGIDRSGTMHIAYYDRTRKHLEGYQFYPPDTAAYGTIDAGNKTGKFASLALDSAGNPHMVYFDQENHQLKYAAMHR